jgi:uncharacterized membrane protein
MAQPDRSRSKTIGAMTLISFMRLVTSANLTRLLLLALWCLVCGSILAAPIGRAHGFSTAAGLVYLVFAPVCHQLPERSFTLWEYPWAVCQRCSGIYLGLLAGALFHGRALEKLARPSARRSVVVGMTLPLMLDVMLPFTGVWTNGPPSRFATGFLFGAMLSLLLVPGVSEFLREAPWKQTHVKAPHTQGGAS